MLSWRPWPLLVMTTISFGVVSASRDFRDVEREAPLHLATVDPDVASSTRAVGEGPALAELSLAAADETSAATTAVPGDISTGAGSDRLPGDRAPTDSGVAAADADGAAPSPGGPAPATAADSASSDAVAPVSPSPSPAASPTPVAPRRRPGPEGPRVEWSYLGLSIQPEVPRLVSLLGLSETTVAAGYQTTGETSGALTILYDSATGRALKRIRESEPLSLMDARGNLSGLSVRSDQVQLVVHQEEPNGARGTRIIRVPNPQGAIAAVPYLTMPAHFAPDGALILLGSGRDRFYRVNLALGESRPILPIQPLDIVDFAINSEGEIIALDAFEQQLTWLNLEGEVLESVMLTKNETKEPRFYYLSVAAGPARSAWVGVAVRQPDGTFAPEVQRLQGKLRERQRLDRGRGTIGFPLRLAADGAGGIFAADEKNWIFHVSASTQLTRAWQALALPPTVNGAVVPKETGAEASKGVAGAPGSSGKPPASSTTGQRTPGGAESEHSGSEDRIYLAESGAEIASFSAMIDDALPGVRRCYDKLRQVSPAAQGSYRVELLSSDRNIQRVEVYQKDFDDFGLESCVSQAFKGAHFPTRVGRQTLRILLKFVPPGRT